MGGSEGVEALFEEGDAGSQGFILACDLEVDFSFEGFQLGLGSLECNSLELDLDLFLCQLSDRDM